MTDQINLAISQQASFIESKTFTECIPRHFVEQLIENSCLKDKWDLKNYNQLIVSQNYINECQQLKSYLEKYNKKTNAFLVKYPPAAPEVLISLTVDLTIEYWSG